MNKLKLVGLDMDGTLLGKDRILTRHTIDILEKVAAKGVHLVADRIAPPNTEDGVAQVLTELFLSSEEI